MEAATPSRTAMATALMHALHTRADPLPLTDDPWGERLLEPARAVFEARMRELHPGEDADAQMRAGAAYPNVILRARFCEDALRAAVERGVQQYVIVGAGFDSFALRRPDWARDVAILEVDHPATQTYKLERMAACGVAPPQGTTHVAADLGVEALGVALARSPFRAGEPAFFAWLGVTMSLPRAANLATSQEIARVGGTYSELVFSCAHIELVRRYDPQGLNGLRSDALGRIARARVD